MQRVFLINALRTPIALRRGGLAKIRPEIFAASVIRELLRRTNVSADDLDGVFAGNAVGTGGNIARLMSLLSGIPSSVPAVTIDMQCASAAASISLAFAKIAAGQGDCYLAGGLESVSLQPARTYAEGDPRREQLAATGGTYYTAELAPGDLRPDAMLWGAERVMEQEHVTRAELDRYNIHGGALAYGHPYGASGAILAIQLLAALREHSGLGLLSIAGAGGLGEAILVSCL